MTPCISLDVLNQASDHDFSTLLEGVFEHSRWVALQAADDRPFADLDAMHAAMVKRVKTAGPAAQLALICAHPELAGKAALSGQLTLESSAEQAGAGLDQCSPDEYEILSALNHAYKEKFGFPFIVAVRGYDRAGIIGELRRRLDLTLEQERAESLEQIYQIARLRLQDLVCAESP